MDVFYVATGHIKVYDITAQGIEKLILILGPGDVFPLLWTFRGVSSLHYFYESLDDVVLKVIPCEDFIKAVKENHRITLNMLQYFVDTTKDLMSRIECIEASGAKRKTAQVIMYLALAHGTKATKNSYKVALPITHQSIANMAGITRETASLQLKELENEGLFVMADDTIIANLAKITAFLEEE